MILLFFTVLLPVVLCETDDDSALHFSDIQNGRAVWIVDESSLPWSGSYDYLRLNTSGETVLLTVVDSSTGRILGECSEFAAGESRWSKFEWHLKSDSLFCSVSPKNSSRIVFPLPTGPRTFSVRIEAVRGPLCLRDLEVQGEHSLGCPPHLTANSFSSHFLNCSCPYDREASTDPPFPIFDLDGSQTFSTRVLPTFAVSPCADFMCLNNGTCVVAQEGTAACLCRDGFIGALCEIDVCSSVPCQNGGSCVANGGEARCECSSGFTGILCESVIETCQPPCMNGKCIIGENSKHCECKQGFIGDVCNIVDVCLGDAACALFGDEARCVVDENDLKQTSASLHNASYECRCPHPINNEYVDCLALHLSTSVFESIPTAMPTGTTQVFFNSGFGRTTLLPTSIIHTTAEEVERTNRPVGAGLLPVVTAMPEQTTRTFTFFTPPPTTPSSHFTNNPLEITTIPVDLFTTTATVGEHSETGPTQLLPSTASVEDREESTTVATQGFSSVGSGDFTVTELSPTTMSTTTTTTPTEVRVTPTTTVSQLSPSSITMSSWQPTETATEQSQYPTNFTPQSSIPFWMTVTQAPPPSLRTTTATPEITFGTQSSKTVVSRPEGTTESGSSIKMSKAGVDDSNGNRSSAASWIIAIVAMIVLGLLLLATTLFVLRYVRQSRKLHGKYNPAREEHALSAAFSMPMSHISKEERLI